MSFLENDNLHNESTTKRIEYLLMLKLLSKMHENERMVLENLQKDCNEYAEVAKSYHKNATILCELLSHSSDRNQIMRSSKLVEELSGPQLKMSELQESVDFLKRNGDFEKQRDFLCESELPVATTVELVTQWHRGSCAKGVSLNKMQHYVYRLKKSTGRIHKVFLHSNKRLRFAFKRLMELWMERFDHSFIHTRGF